MPALSAGNFVRLYMDFGRCSQLVTGLVQYMPDVEPSGDCRSRHPDRHECLLVEKVQVRQKVVLGHPPNLSMMEDVCLRARRAMKTQKLEETKSRKGLVPQKVL